MKHKVTSRDWEQLPDIGPVASIDADNRVAIDIDYAGKGWARIARGNDNEVEIEVSYGARS